jgi:hypothetical protein
MPETLTNLRSPSKKNYVVPGRVSCWFRKKGSSAVADWVDLGNIVASNFAAEIERLAHYSNRAGERAKDREIITQRQARMTFRIDEINKANLQFVFGSVAAAAAGSLDIKEAKVLKNPGGAGTINVGMTNIKNVIIRSVGLEGTPTTYVNPTDYTEVLATGVITIAGGGALANASNVPEVHIFWEKAVNSESFEVHDGAEVEGELQFQGLTKGGIQYAIVCANVVLRADGDVNFGDGTGWQEMGLAAEILTDANGKLCTKHIINEAAAV